MKKNVRSKLMPFLCAMAYCCIFVFFTAAVLFGLWKEFAQMCACIAGSFFCLGAYLCFSWLVKSQMSQSTADVSAQKEIFPTLEGVSLTADCLRVDGNVKLELPLEDASIRIERVRDEESNQLMITTDISKNLCTLWTNPLSGNALIVEVR
jgi:hypothetical protein